MRVLEMKTETVSGFNDMETTRDLSVFSRRNVWARNQIIMGKGGNQVWNMAAVNAQFVRRLTLKEKREMKQ